MITNTMELTCIARTCMTCMHTQIHCIVWWFLSNDHKRQVTNFRRMILEFTVDIEGIPGPVCGIVLVHDMCTCLVHMYP